MEYQCSECYEKYKGNSHRLPLDHDNSLIPQGSDRYPKQYKCPKCNNGHLVFLPLSRKEVIKLGGKDFDREFYFNDFGNILTLDLIKKKGYNQATFKFLGIFPDNLLAINYYLFLKKNKSNK